eukprot:Nk52_evm34s210 gene=Nk52_evmTU34s210
MSSDHTGKAGAEPVSEDHGEAVSVRDTFTVMTQIVLPSDCTPSGVCLGGRVLAWIDICAGLASRHLAHYPCVTASVDNVHFQAPCMRGDLLVLTAVVNRAFGSSMEIGVKVEIEHVASGQMEYCCGAYLTFVSIGPSGKPHKLKDMVSPLESSPVAFERWNRAMLRRQDRLARAKSGKDEHNHCVLPFSLLQLYCERHSMQSMARNFHALSSQQEEDMIHLQEKEGNATKQRRLSARKLSSSGNTPLKVYAGDTLTCTTHIVMPQHANTLKVTFGGQIMEWMEQSAYISATRFFKTSELLSASVDGLKFLHPTRVGDLVYIMSRVTTAYRTSVEVIVSVYVQSYYTIDEPNSGKKMMRTDPPRLCNSGFLTIVSSEHQNQLKNNLGRDKDDAGLLDTMVNMVEDRELVAETDAELAMVDENGSRRAERLRNRDTMLQNSH